MACCTQKGLYTALAYSIWTAYTLVRNLLKWNYYSCTSYMHNIQQLNRNVTCIVKINQTPRSPRTIDTKGHNINLQPLVAPILQWKLNSYSKKQAWQFYTQTITPIILLLVISSSGSSEMGQFLASASAPFAVFLLHPSFKHNSLRCVN